MTPIYPRIHIVINPASGKDEPILNTLNDVFNAHGIDWSVSITHRYGDATASARAAAESGHDLVAGYGGDGTQHEVATGLLDTGVVMGVLPGGTGNGFARELGIPNDLRSAAELLCISERTRAIDVVQTDRGPFIQRLYVGIEPEEQTSREAKNKYGTLAYVLTARNRTLTRARYRVYIDGHELELQANQCYVVNASHAGSGLSVTGGRSVVDDGLLEFFPLDLHNPGTVSGAALRMFKLPAPIADQFFWQGRSIEVDTDPDQPVWADGEQFGRTPISMEVQTRALRIVVP